MDVYCLLILMALVQGSLQQRPDERMYRGSNAKPHSAPYIVSLRLVAFNNRISPLHVCGGSILNECWVVSAGHCVAGLGDLDKYARLKVYAGAHDFREEPTPVLQVRDVVKILLHPNITFATATFVKYADIMLIRVSKPFNFNEFVQRIALAPQGYTPKGLARVFGWGYIFQHHLQNWIKIMPNALQTRELRILHQGTCNDYEYHLFQTVTSSILCTEPSEDYFTICGGDSGGPLVARIGGEMRLVGLASFASDYCGKKYPFPSPSMFTRVNAFEDWIFEHIGKK